MTVGPLAVGHRKKPVVKIMLEGHACLLRAWGDSNTAPATVLSDSAGRKPML